MADDNTGEAQQPTPSTTTGTTAPVARPSTAFERPPGNVHVVPDDGGPALDDLSQRPTVIAPVEIADAGDHQQTAEQTPSTPDDHP